MIASVRAALRALLAAPIEALQDACDALDPEDRDRLRALVETAPRIAVQLSVSEGDRFSAGWGVGYVRGVVANMHDLADEQEAEGAISPAELRARADAFEANADKFIAQLGRGPDPRWSTKALDIPPLGPPLEAHEFTPAIAHEIASHKRAEHWIRDGVAPGEIVIVDGTPAAVADDDTVPIEVPPDGPPPRR